MTQPGLKLSIVIPAYNEAGKIKNTFSRLERFFSQKPYEMEYVFVDDGSSDDTLAVLRELQGSRRNIKIRVNEKNTGKGYSIRKGMLSAEGAYCLFMDADMSTSLGAFDEFEKSLGGFDIIMGSRWKEESNVKIPQPWCRKIMGHVFYAIVRAFLLKGITDTNCGFKCYRREAARDLFSKQRLRGWGFDVELLYIAQKRGYRIKEIPVVWGHGRDSRVNLFVVPALTLMELAAIKINDWKGRYEK